MIKIESRENTSLDVSIAMLTYNHEKFIHFAFESILTQKTSLNYQIVVADDFSTDNTRNIILEYKKRYPKKIKIIFQDANVGPNKNNIDLFNNLDGRYIAALEGDDYWTDENKLQKQFDFMEANPNYSCVFHDSIIVDENNNYLSDFSKHKPKNPIAEKEIISKGGNLASTASMFFRNYNEYPDFLKNAKSGDRALRLFLMTKGKFYFIDKKMGAYRKHSSGLTKGGDKTTRILFIESNIELLNNFNNYSNGKYKKNINKELSNMAKNYSYFTKSIFNKYTLYLGMFDYFKVIIYRFFCI